MSGPPSFKSNLKLFLRTRVFDTTIVFHNYSEGWSSSSTSGGKKFLSKKFFVPIITTSSREDPLKYHVHEYWCADPVTGTLLRVAEIVRVIRQTDRDSEILFPPNCYSHHSDSPTLRFLYNWKYNFMVICLNRILGRADGSLLLP